MGIMMITLCGTQKTLRNRTEQLMLSLILMFYLGKSPQFFGMLSNYLVSGWVIRLGLTENQLRNN